ncbi:hypothetical protein GKU25_14640 [Salmonella enterica]|uniref:Uncharacterized protein n=4 Tax=Salmonella enterica TaxID=28901 RepID=A0A5T8NL74_SALER|nr:hypothetical protein [Salmonella enterica]EAA7394785.1 hypothetical protein [Salmonella enterica subsp. enterica serovar Newport]EBP3473883.1 hypothetical protein [Salmonella enterica subsp. enterica]EBV2480781.1 hypothetical protein [Salmonella enterica subsp. enterica serovar Javiana]EBX9486989.1 hypothetical protein [Salmonella enterica subsp. enterica serovar Rubislaw]ECC2881972.1 hypothetical protein [Salmonella enterica subsp. arizonae]ECY3616728.1 hypothetical protein [Salmonella en
MSKFTSKEVALAFMQANGTGMKAEDFLVQLIDKEKEFEELLSKDDLKGFLKARKAEAFKKLVS